MRTKIYIGIIAAIMLGFALFVAIGFNNLAKAHDSIGRKVVNFPDKEYCSLGCGVGWETYVEVGGKFDDNGYCSCAGDKVNWLIKDGPHEKFRFDGLFYTGNGISGLEILFRTFAWKGLNHYIWYIFR